MQLNINYDEEFNKICLTHDNQELYSIQQRISMLSRLKSAVLSNQEQILDAMWTDMHKSREQVLFFEFSNPLHEADYFINNLNSLSKQRVEPKTLLALNAKVYTKPEPLGPTLIITPFNYPVALSLSPLFGCIAAGNPVVLKYSSVNAHLQKAMKNVLQSAQIPPSQVLIYEHPTDLLFKNKQYALVIFTGSTATGRTIQQQCGFAKCILELGGCNPLVIDEDADIVNVCQQIALAKFTNAGQTCIAPNYAVYCGGDEGYARLKEELKRKVSDYMDQYRHLCKVVSGEKYEELAQISREKKLVIQIFDGKVIDEDSKANQAELLEKQRKDQLFPPTVVEASWEDNFVHKEIFGPLLPLVRFKTVDKFIAAFKEKYVLQNKPLAAYLFSKNKQIVCDFKQKIQAGAISINQCLMYFSTSLPFGGLGQSGLGYYHGKYSFEQFSHLKPINEVPENKLNLLINKAILLPAGMPYRIVFNQAIKNITLNPICNTNIAYFVLFILVISLLILLHMKQ